MIGWGGVEWTHDLMDWFGLRVMLVGAWDISCVLSLNRSECSWWLLRASVGWFVDWWRLRVFAAAAVFRRVVDFGLMRAAHYAISILAEIKSPAIAPYIVWTVDLLFSYGFSKQVLHSWDIQALSVLQISTTACVEVDWTFAFLFRRKLMICVWLLVYSMKKGNSFIGEVFLLGMSTR